MPLASKVEREVGDEVLTLSRSFDAPPELLFRLWAEPEHRVRWWGPSGMALSRCEVDFRVGGQWRVTMKNAGGYEHPVYGSFTEIDEPRRLCFTYVNEYDGHEMLVEMDFEREGDGTRMHFRQTPFVSRPERDGHGYGWTSTLSILATYASKVRNTGGAAPVGHPRKPGDF
jgi:uncharacterized protein YndB with AHSA1/START domain